MSPNHMIFVTMVATEIGAGATFIAATATAATAIIAYRAAQTWRTSLQQQREDECTAALHTCAAIIGQAVTYKETQDPNAAEARKEAWASWRDFRKTYAVVRRYRTAMTDDRLKPGIDVLQRLNAFGHTHGASDPVEGAAINSAFGKFIAAIEQAMTGRTR